MVWDASGVEVSEAACCADILRLGKSSRVIATRAIRHFIGFLATSASVIWMSRRLEAGRGHAGPALMFRTRLKLPTGIFHFCDASWKLSDVTVLRFTP